MTKKLMKREIEKFPYGTLQGLSKSEARDNIIATEKVLSQVIKTYGPTVLRIGIIVYLMPESAFAEGTPTSAPTDVAPSSNQVLPAAKELLGIAAVGLICAAASANPVTAIGIAACVVAIAAKAANKL